MFVLLYGPAINNLSRMSSAFDPVLMMSFDGVQHTYTHTPQAMIENPRMNEIWMDYN